MGNDRRRPIRKNAGVPPKRLGFPAQNRTDSERDDGAGSQTSIKSSESKSSTVRETSASGVSVSSAKTSRKSTLMHKKQDIDVLRARLAEATARLAEATILRQLAEAEAEQEVIDSQYAETEDGDRSDVTGGASVPSKNEMTGRWVDTAVLDAPSSHPCMLEEGVVPNITPQVTSRSDPPVPVDPIDATNVQSTDSMNLIQNNSNHEVGMLIVRELREGFSNINATAQPMPGSDILTQFLTRQSVGKKLSSFSGRPEEWLQFITQYRNTTEMCGLKDYENLVRLQECLSGEAREAVLPMLTIPDNVEEIMRILENSFGDPARIVMHLISLAKTTSAPRSGHPESMVKFSNAVRNMVKTMETLKCYDDLRNPQLLRELAAKLPDHYQLQWCQLAVSVGDVDLTIFSQWLTDQARVASFQSLLKSSHWDENHKDKAEKKDEKKAHHGVVFTATQPTPQRSFKNHGCVVCAGDKHRLEHCSKFTGLDLDGKWKLANEKRLCFSCLIPGHRAAECRKKTLCGVDGCSSSHSPLLHKSIQGENVVLSHQVSRLSSSSTVQTMLRIIPVKLTGPNGTFETFALLDEGSTVTLMDSSLANKLGLQGPTESLCVKWTHDVIRNTPGSKRVSLGIAGITPGSKSFQLRDVRTVPNMQLPSQTVDLEGLINQWPYLQHAHCGSFRDAKPSMLIGHDNYLLTAPRKVLHGKWNDPIATKTWLGWVVHGAIPSAEKIENVFACHSCDYTDVDLNSIHQLVKHSFCIENFGVKSKKKFHLSKEDIKATAILEATTHRVGQRWETGLLWRNKHIVTPDSRPTALNRLHCLEQRMDKDTAFAQHYCTKIEDLREKGYIRKLSSAEVALRSAREWYLPHFGVTNPNKPGKLRVVFDLAAKSRGVSLNDFLLTGPDLLNSLTAVLWRFRVFRFAFAADIKEMFLRVLIPKEDSESQRFFWRGLDRRRSPDVYAFNVVVFGSTCSPASANYVKIKNSEEFKDEFPTAHEMVLHQSYMDDFMGGGDSEEDTIKIIKDLIEVHRRGGFELCNWTSNSKVILNQIPTELKASGVKDLSPEESIPVERVLGMWWDPELDCFTFKLNFFKVPEGIKNGTQIPTKRQVLQLVMSVFDPIGFLAFFTIKAKILLQDIWKFGVGWDEMLKEEIAEKWKKWILELQKITEVKIPRHYCTNIGSANSLELHVFCDSSDKAYAAVAYFVVRFGDIVNTAFVAGKSKVAPLKLLSIPRLELEGALLAANLYVTIIEEHRFKINKTWFWCDSMTVLGWLRTETRRLNQYVGNRIGEILELTTVNDWRYIPTQENVADDATRDLKLCDFSSSSRWFCGPSFLKMKEDDWPREVPNQLKMRRVEIVAIISETHSYLPNISRFSTWKKLIRSTAWVLRFIQNCRKCTSKTNNLKPLSSSELKLAEVHWIKRCQLDSFEPELQSLKSKKNVSRSSRLFQLSPGFDENEIIILRGRVDAASVLKEATRRPIILDPKHLYTKLLIQEYHVRMNHQGQETVINELRQQYWVLQMRQAVSSCFRNCQYCKIKKCRLMNPPEMGQLPTFRFMKKVRPFSYAGMDYFGPISVKVGKRNEKKYGVIFNCMSTRAVHLELAENLTTDATINAIRRFIGRRGQPVEIFSDNATNLRGADIQLKEAVEGINKMKLENMVMQQGIRWSYNPPASPHMGGAWESLIKTVKTSLRAVLQSSVPKEDTLRTFLVEVENIINSRPLTHVSVDPNDPESLTPNHLLLGSSSGASSPGVFTEKDVSLRTQWKWVQILADNFWSRWVKEYLPTLARRSKWHQTEKSLRVDDVVAIAATKGLRNMWLLGRIENVYPGKDGQVRVVDIRTKFGIFRRPVVKLCKLEVHNEDHDSE